MTAPREGSIEWVRCFYDRRIKRGAQVEVDGARAVVLSARSGRLFVRVWSSGQRIGVTPDRVSVA